MAGKQIKRAQVFGMRCSGTNYLDALIRANLTDIKMVSFGWKHGDLGTAVYDYSDGRRKPIAIERLDWPTSRDAIIFVVYRSPISWLQSLHLSPHHSPESYGLEFSDFIRNPWRSFYCPPGSERLPARSQRMRYARESNLLEQAESVFDLRKRKIAIFESFKHRFQHVVYVNYESLAEHPAETIATIAHHYNLRQAPAFHDVTTYKGGSEAYQKKIYQPVSSEDLQHILKNISWPHEHVVGYGIKPGLPLKIKSKKAHAEPDDFVKKVPRHRYFINGELAAVSNSKLLSQRFAFWNAHQGILRV